MKNLNFYDRKNGSTYVVAELSCNHLQRFDLAVETIHAIKESNADAVKIQTYTADTMTIDSKKSYFTDIHKGTIWENMNLYELYQQAYTPWEWHNDLKKEAEKLGLDFFSTPFDKSAVDFLEKHNNPIYKVASFEITDIPLIKYIASKNKPIIMSTGIAKLADIELAVNSCKEVGNEDVTLLKCNSAYPSPIEDTNLKTIPNLRDTFGVKVGLSDHSLSNNVAIAAVALGATIIEKHFILDRKLGGHDCKFSLEPNEFKDLVISIREVEKALGNVDYNLNKRAEISKMNCRSIFVVQDIKKGEMFTEKNIRSIRPGMGLHPKYFDLLLRSRASKDLSKGTPLSFDLIGSY